MPFDPISWLVGGTLIKLMFGAAVGAAIVLTVLNWSRIVDWFQGNEHHMLADPNNIAVMVRQAQQNGKVGVVTGIFNKATEKVVVSQNYNAGSLDEETKRNFGSNDVCIIQ
jgi:hypothetical protein